MMESQFSPAVRAAREEAIARTQAVDSGWFYNDPAFREAEAELRSRFGKALAQIRRRLSAAGVTDPQAVARAEMPVRLHFAAQFRSLYNSQAAREQERRERRREARKARRSRIFGTLLTIATRGLIQAGLNRQRYYHSQSLDRQRYDLKQQPISEIPAYYQPRYAAVFPTEGSFGGNG